MIKALEDAIEKVRTLPPERQADIAALLQSITAEGDVYRLTDDERSLVREGLAELDRGEVASSAEVRAVFDKFRAP